jgi:transcriptional regulator of nitric oxide reductase
MGFACAARARRIRLASDAVQFFPEATRFGEQQGEPPILPVFAVDRWSDMFT